MINDLSILSTLALIALCGCTGGAAPGGAGGAGGAAASDAVTLALDSFVVPGGGEVYKCQNFANPFGGRDAEVSEFESHMTTGSHHLILFYKPDVTQDGPLEDCSGLEFEATPYLSQQPDDSLSFPAGVAALVPKGMGLRLQAHYLNTGATVTAHVTVTLHEAAPGSVTDHAGVLFVNEPNIHIPPEQTGVVSHQCHLPFDMKLTRVMSHMHRHGIKFESTIAGSTLFDTTQWREPKPASFSPARQVKGGDLLSFACTFANDMAQTLTFGESAATNEMCALVASFYPLPDASPVTVGCD
jgi:hypothetical protein